MAFPRFEATEERRAIVRKLAGIGLPQDQIARIIGCAESALKLRFPEELKLGSAEATAAVAETLYAMATSGQNTAATIFWMKVRAKWSEKSELQITGKDGGPACSVSLIATDPVEAARVYQRLMDGSRGNVIDAEPDGLEESRLHGGLPTAH